VRHPQPLKIQGKGPMFRLAVPRTAAGSQGEKPLVQWDNVGKGSRQNGSVTSGKGLAPRVEPRGLHLDSGSLEDVERFIWPLVRGVTTLHGGKHLGSGYRVLSFCLLVPSERVQNEVQQWGNGAIRLTLLALNNQLGTVTDQGNPTV